MTYDEMIAAARSAGLDLPESPSHADVVMAVVLCGHAHVEITAYRVHVRRWGQGAVVIERCNDTRESIATACLRAYLRAMEVL